MYADRRQARSGGFHAALAGHLARLERQSLSLGDFGMEEDLRRSQIEQLEAAISNPNAADRLES